MTEVASTSTIAERLGQFAAATSWDRLPPAVREACQVQFAQALARGLAAAHSPFGAKLLALEPTGPGEPEADVIGVAERAPASGAAFRNGALASSTDDASGLLMAAALAAGQQARAKGGDVLAGFAVGSEVFARLTAAAGEGVERRGLLAVTLFGALAAATVAGRLYGLDAGAMANAMGVAGSFASGSLSMDADGRRLAAGWAARSGVLAAQLARTHFTGPRAVLEGERGLLRAFAEPPFDLDLATEGLGQHWRYSPGPSAPAPAPIRAAVERMATGGDVVSLQGVMAPA